MTGAGYILVRLDFIYLPCSVQLGTLGVAIRIATDLNLHHPTAMKFQGEMHEREILNRTRLWMVSSVVA
jgi:hypothetical protein